MPCFLSDDSSRIRARRIASPPHDYWRVWTPDGVERELTYFIGPDWNCTTAPPELNCTREPDFSGWYTTRILDPIGTGSITVQYDDDAPLPEHSKKHCLLRVFDSVRGPDYPTIEFQNKSQAEMGGEPGARGGITTGVKVQIAGTETFYRLDNHHWIPSPQRPCMQGNLTGGPAVNVLEALALKVDLNNNELVTDFTWDATAGIPTEVDLPGDLAHASYDWVCGEYAAFESFCGSEPCPCEIDLSGAQMVREKTVGTGLYCDQEGLDCWTYDRQMFSDECPECNPCGPPSPTECPPPTNPNKVTVTLPATRGEGGALRRHERIHYFNSGFQQFGASCPRPPIASKNGLERRIVHVTRTGPGPGDREVTEREFFDYKVEPPMSSQSEASDPRLIKYRKEFCGDANRFYEKTFDDDDSLGHFREAVEVSNEGLGTISRRTRTNYDHTAASLEQWWLGRISDITVRASDSTTSAIVTQTDLVYDEFGRLLQETRKGILPGAADIVVNRGWTGQKLM